ncbi:hypothetical protein KP509_30G057100 [Ceratopteris richardii]|uniref:Fibronectin type-III domain-containing protein n=1 Tax=Ceratopteris richardii TaxID=49495 RepID=A0A8T2R4C2_CERRI|nr:hypothetical protein KP509_30G057100 [Ceratopteris richardii]
MTSTKADQFEPDAEAYSSMVGSLSLPERREFLYKTAKGFEGGRQTLESWTRKDLLELICLEMGKERKYTGVSKSKMVEHLLKLVSTKGLTEGVESPVKVPTLQSTLSQSSSKRQRKAGRPARVSLAVQTPTGITNTQKSVAAWVCKNTACKAQLPQGTSFCQRCSCCICKKFDDNKDPSLWIVCTPDPLNKEMDCRLSCHIECALTNRMAGVVMEGLNIVLDGSYQCPCGKISSLIRCWKKQLLIAKDARRVDTLCQRLYLSYRLLEGTCKYKLLHELVDQAIQRLEIDVGVITEGSAKFARGLVNRLSSNSKVLELVHLALEKVEALDGELAAHPTTVEAAASEERDIDDLCIIEFNDISSGSVSMTVQGGEHMTGYRLWHRKACDLSFAKDPTCIIAANPGQAQISGLDAHTEYVFYVVPSFEKGYGDPVEVRCTTKDSEFKVSNGACETAPLNVDLNASTTETDLPVAENLESNFKVRELGKVLHSAWAEEYQSTHMHKGIFHRKDGMKSLIDRKNDEEKKSECRSPSLNVMSSRGVNVSHVDCGTSKSSPDKAPSSDLNAEESRVTLEVDLPNPPIRTLSRRDSSALVPDSDPKGRMAHTEITDLDNASDPGNSHTSQREETEALSQVVSDVMQTNAANGVQDASEDRRRIVDIESNGRHGESWAVQVRRTAGTNIEMDTHATVMRKRTSESFGRGEGYGLVNGCGGGSISAPLCAARNYEFCVKIIRWLECEGYLKEDFRMKFLTWFSLKASEHEKRVVSVFIDTLQDNPSSLAGQLVDTFSDIISMKRHHMMPNGFHNKLWH